MRKAHIPLLLLLSACGRYETGIDRTVLQGKLFIPPVSTAEQEQAEGDNDDLTLAQDLGELGFQVQVLTGDSLSAGYVLGEPTGDLDWYTFTPRQDGTTAFSLLYPGIEGEIDAENPPEEPVIMLVDIVNLSEVDEAGEPVVVYSGTTRDFYGDAEFSLDVIGGDTYAMRLAERANTSGDTSYTLVAWGFDPTGTQFLIGAYAEEDIFSRGDPLGGTSVNTFAMNDYLTWEAEFEILAIRSLVTVTDTAGVPTSTVDEAIPSVYLHAGTFSSLNASVLAGDLYSTAPTSVTLSTDDASTDLHTDLVVTCDAVQPIQFGWTFVEAETEEETNDVEIDYDTYSLVGDLANADVLEIASGLGFVDRVDGSLVYLSDDPGWADDNDIYALTVPEQMGATLTLGWADPVADLDLHLFDSAGNFLVAGWYTANSNPEIITTGDWGIVFEPGETYYIGVFGYSGLAGDYPYELSIEYTSP